jgi:hypothetical protein
LLDDWYMSAMQGTESVISVARDVFVPAARATPFVLLLAGEHASDANRGAGGATSFRLDIPGQREGRNAAMLSNHALLNYEANLSLFGALKLGNDPQTIFL